MVLSLNTTRAKQGGIIIQEINMKRDLYRFAKARRNKRVELFKLTKEQLEMIEYKYYSRFNTNYYKQNIKSIG